MPRLKKKTKKRRAQKLSRLYIKSGMNAAKVARQKGITRQSVQQQINQPEVQEIITEVFEKIAKQMDFTCEKAMEFALYKMRNAKRIISANIVEIKSTDPTVKSKKAHSRTQDFIEVEDENMQHKWFVTVAEMCGWLRKGSEIKIMSQTFVGAELVKQINELENAQIRPKTNRRLDT